MIILQSFLSLMYCNTINYNILFFIGCAFSALHAILSLRSLLINRLDRKSLTLNSQLSLICDYLSLLAFSV